MKKDPKVINYLHNNNTHISIRNWKDEEWDLKVIGIFTNLYPGQMSIKYSTKIISRMIKSPRKQQHNPKFRIKPTIMRTSTGHENFSVRTYSIEVKAQDSREMMTIFRETSLQAYLYPSK
jgi:hypothetical protein